MMSHAQRDGAALLILRVGLAWFMFLWAIHKVITPKQYQGLAKNFDGIALSFEQIYLVAAVQIGLCVLTALGVLRPFSYSALAVMHFFTVTRRWEGFFDPFALNDRGFPIHRNQVIDADAIYIRDPGGWESWSNEQLKHMAISAATALGFALTPVVNEICRLLASRALQLHEVKAVNSGGGGNAGVESMEVYELESQLAATTRSSNILTEPLVCGVSISQFVLGLLSAGIVFSWLISGHWILNDVLGAALCITFTSYVRLPNLKVCTVLLLCLFTYDIFWVFLSERFFGENVMV